MAETRELKGITPTYQSVLNKQLGKVTDAIDSGDPVDAFIKLRTLIILLNPKDRDPLLKNEVSHIHERVRQVTRRRKIDVYDQRRTQKANVTSVLRTHILDLYSKTMTVLHEGGYLEKRGPPIPEGTEKGLRV